MTTDAGLAAVDRTARVTAEAAGQVLSTLIGGNASATLPQIEADPDDPLGKLTYPLIAVEVSYVSGVNGANLFVLSPAQGAMLAAVMMGLDEPMGDGLTELELSAVSEAMNQMMGAATNVLADTLSLDIEVAPPVCTVIHSAEEARAQFPVPAYCARFRLVSDRLSADVVQLVPAEFAEHLRQAYAAVDIGRAAVSAEQSNPAAGGGMGFDRQRPARLGGVDAGSLGTVRVRVSAELGRTHLPIGDVLNMPPGSVVQLDRLPTDPIDVLVNGRPYASARLVLVDGEYAVQIVKLMPQPVAA